MSSLFSSYWTVDIQNRQQSIRHICSTVAPLCCQGVDILQGSRPRESQPQQPVTFCPWSSWPWGSIFGQWAAKFCSTLAALSLGLVLVLVLGQRHQLQRPWDCYSVDVHGLKHQPSVFDICNRFSYVIFVNFGTPFIHQNRSQYRQNCVLSVLKSTRLEKSTLPLVVAAVANVSYEHFSSNTLWASAKRLHTA